MMSSRSATSSPIMCKAPEQPGQVLSAMSTTCTIRGRCAGSDPRLARRLATLAARRSGSAASALASVQLVDRQALGPAAEVVTLQFLDDLGQALGPGPLGDQHRLERRRIIRQGVSQHRHGRRLNQNRGPLRRPYLHPESTCRSQLTASGTRVRRTAWTRRQSSPSSSA